MKLVHDVNGAVRCGACRVWSPHTAAYCINCGESLSNPNSPEKERVESARSLFVEGYIDPKQYITLKLRNPPQNPMNSGITWERHVEANTEQFYRALLPSMEQLMNPVLQGTATIERTILLYGRIGSGKSAKTRTIIEKVRQFYGAKNVAVHEALGEGFRAILDAEKWPRRLIQVVALQDCGRVKFTDADLRDFWRMRHIMAEKTGLKRGLILLIFGSHGYFELPAVFRNDTDMILMSDLPTNPYHKQAYQQHFIPTPEDQTRVRTLARERLNDPKLCGYAYMLDHGEPAGFVYLPQVEAKRTGVLTRLARPSDQSTRTRELFIPLVSLFFLGLTAYSYLVQQNIAGALLWGALFAVIAISWVLARLLLKR